MIRILHITQPSNAGVSKYINIINKHIDKLDFQIAVAFPGDPGSQLYTECKRNKTLFYSVALKRNISPINDLRGLIQLYRIIKNYQPDIIHLHSSKAGFLGRIIGKICNVPSIYTPNAFAFLGYRGIKRTLFLMLEKIMIPFTSHFLGCSLSEKNIAVQMVGIPGHKAQFISNSIESKNGKIKERKNYQKNIIFIGRNSYQKNLHMFCRVAEKLLSIRSDVHIQIIGVGKDEFNGADINAIIKTLGNSKRVAITEWADEPKINEILENTHILVMTSRYEGLPFVALEAQTIGIPIVGTNVVGINDVVVENKNGFLVRVDDDDVMINKILSLLNDEELYKKISIGARQFINEHYSIEKNIKLLEDYYKSAYMINK